MLLREAPCCLLENDPILLLRWNCQSSNDKTVLGRQLPCSICALQSKLTSTKIRAYCSCASMQCIRDSLKTILR